MDMDEGLALTIDRLRELRDEGRRLYERIPWWSIRTRRYWRWKLACLDAIIDQSGER